MDIFQTISLDEVNLHYWYRYINFIKLIQNKGERDLGYKEIHHIIPKSINKDLEKDINNLIDLTIREHFIAHKLLDKCFQGLFGEKMSFALWCMMSLNKEDRVISSRDYEKARKNISDIISKKLKNVPKTIKHKQRLSDNHRSKHGYDSPTKGLKGLQLPYFGKKYNYTEQALDKRIENFKKYCKEHPDKFKGENNGNYGKKYKFMNKENIQKQIPIDKIDSYLEEGWVFGKLVSNVSGRIWINNGTINKRVVKEELNNYLESGWITGWKRY